MRYTLKMQGMIVGRSTLERRDAAERRAAGEFQPGGAWELVEPVFDLASAAAEAGRDSEQRRELAERYRRASEKLRFELESPDGTAMTVREVLILRKRGTLALQLRVDNDRFWAADG